MRVQEREFGVVGRVQGFDEDESGGLGEEDEGVDCRD